jgi:hypothetical protein
MFMIRLCLNRGIFGFPTPPPQVYTVYVTNDVLYLIGSDMGLGQADPDG